MSALRPNASQTEAATNMAANHKQNQIFTPIVGATLGSREATLFLPGWSSGLSGTPNSPQTLRHIAIKATENAWKIDRGTVRKGNHGFERIFGLSNCLAFHKVIFEIPES